MGPISSISPGLAVAARRQARPARVEPSAPTTLDATSRSDPVTSTGPSERYGIRTTCLNKVGLRSSGTQRRGREIPYICATGTTKIEDKGRQSADPEVLQELAAATDKADPGVNSSPPYTQHYQAGDIILWTTGFS